MELGAKTASIFKKDQISSFSVISFEDIYNEKKDFSSTKAFLEGFMFADYSFENFKSKKSPEHTFEAEIITAMPRLKKYIDGLCWDNPSWYDTCTYEKCQSVCKRYIENDEDIEVEKNDK